MRISEENRIERRDRQEHPRPLDIAPSSSSFSRTALVHISMCTNGTVAAQPGTSQRECTMPSAVSIRSIASRYHRAHTPTAGTASGSARCLRHTGPMLIAFRVRGEPKAAPPPLLPRLAPHRSPPSAVRPTTLRKMISNIHQPPTESSPSASNLCTPRDTMRDPE